MRKSAPVFDNPGFLVLAELIDATAREARAQDIKLPIDAADTRKLIGYRIIHVIEAGETDFEKIKQAALLST
jgi:hypothetical protein